MAWRYAHPLSRKRHRSPHTELLDTQPIAPSRYNTVYARNASLTARMNAVTQGVAQVETNKGHPGLSSVRAWFGKVQLLIYKARHAHNLNVFIRLMTRGSHYSNQQN